MNVIVANEKQMDLAKLDIDVIKSVTGTFDASVLVDMFKSFFFNKMILDVTALNNYSDISSYRTLISGLDPDKIIFYFTEGSNLCTANFLANLVNNGIYNFTTNLDGVEYLIGHSNSYDDVKHILTLAKANSFSNNNISDNPNVSHNSVSTTSIPSVVGPKIIGIKNLTKQAGATTFVYMLKREIASALGEEAVLAIEIDKNDFNVFSDRKILSISKEEIRSVLRKSINYKVILLDMNDFPDESLCSDVYYLLEPSIIKLNKLIRGNKEIFSQLKDRRVVLNKSLLSDKDVSDFEYESRISVFYNMPPLDDRKLSDAMYKFAIKANLVEGNLSNKENSRVFGLFRR